MNISGVSRKKAFLGNITTAVRNKAWELCRDSETILDVCCGNGLFFLHSKEKTLGKRLLAGIDTSMELLQEAKKIFQDNSIEGISLIRGDAFQLPFKPETFDRVVCVNTLLNLASLDIIETLLVELMRICKPTGRLLIEIRNQSNPYIRLKYWMHSRKQNFPVRAYKIEDISNIIERHEFHCTGILPIGCPVEFIAKAFLIEAGRIKQS
ncbi:MAG TPA: class I SAM-dependent methyltransferase [Candidatus Wunengus sp. YC63]|uniref:class I SAM-dependent methyltransferase n=1 Tax=unclassified Candidatus Wunengus TaxID=3367695 RepID=UPI0040271084